MARVLLYTVDACPHCAVMREELLASGRSLEEVNLTREPRFLTEFLKLTGGRRIVPVVVEGARIAVAPGGGTEF